MKEIVLPAIVALVVTVGVYHIALLAGASEPTAVVASAAVATAFVVVVAVAFALTAAAAFAVVAFATAFAAVVAVAGSVVVAFVAFAVAVAFVAFAVAFAFKEEHMRFKWVVPAYVVLGLAVWGALTVGNVGWSAAIVLGGIGALFTLWRAHSRFAAPLAPLSASAVPEQTGA